MNFKKYFIIAIIFLQSIKSSLLVHYTLDCMSIDASQAQIQKEIDDRKSKGEILLKIEKGKESNTLNLSGFSDLKNSNKGFVIIKFSDVFTGNPIKKESNVADQVVPNNYFSPLPSKITLHKTDPINIDIIVVPTSKNFIENVYGFFGPGEKAWRIYDIYGLKLMTTAVFKNNYPPELNDYLGRALFYQDKKIVNDSNPRDAFKDATPENVAEFFERIKRWVEACQKALSLETFDAAIVFDGIVEPQEQLYEKGSPEKFIPPVTTIKSRWNDFWKNFSIKKAAFLSTLAISALGLWHFLKKGK
jgi:hypothetical protein